MITFITYLLNLIVLTALIAVAFRFCDAKLLRSIFFPALAFKLFCGGLLGVLFYNYYEGGDTTAYFEQAQNIANNRWFLFWEKMSEKTVSSQPVRAIYFTRILAFLLFFTKANYWLASLYFSFFSFFGSLYFVKQLNHWRPDLTIVGIVAFMFFPSVVFWSSGILKESLAFSSMLILCGGYIKYKSQARLNAIDLLLMIISFFVLSILKYYIAAVLVPMLAYVFIFHELEKRQLVALGFWAKSALIFLALFVPAYLFFIWMSPNLSLDQLSSVVLQSHDAMLDNGHAKNALPTINWFGNKLDVTINVIYYFISGIFRPILPEDLGFPGVFNSIENFFVLILVVWRLIYVKRISIQPEIIALLIYIATTCVFLAYTIPNLGALSRFKVYYMPFLLLLILIDHPIVDKCAKIKFLP